ncbi:MAG: beta-galactosidase [Bacillota bacterium]
MQSLKWLRASARFFKRRGGQAILAAVASMPLWVGTGANADAVVWRKNFFPIGVWSQPIYTFDKWQSRGINTLVKYESYGGEDSINEWITAANAKGFYQIRQPRSKLSADLHESRLLAWMQVDEPDYRKVPVSTLAARYAKMKAADRSKPVLVNLSGGNVLSATSRKAYAKYLASADWISSDLYPVTGWGRPDWLDYSKTTKKTAANRKTLGMAVSRLSEWSKQKRQFAVIETSNQKLSWVNNPRGVRPGELRAQVWDAIIHGARGIIYFPMQIGGGFRYDATPADVVNEMTTQNARIKSLASVINSHSGTVQWVESSSVLEGMTRTSAGDEYFFVLNMSSKPQEDQWIRLKGLREIKDINVVGESRTLNRVKGYIRDDFAPYELHVYQADVNRSEVTPAPIPEPVGLLPAALGALLLRRRRRA